MLVRFRVGNFLSFYEEVELSMVSSLERIHPHHVVKARTRNDVSILKSAIIYGANASGKSNLIAAIGFAQNMILTDTPAKQLIPRHPFRLAEDSHAKPTKFEFEFKCSDTMYAYGFEFTSEKIIEEWLYKITKKNEAPLFKRVRQEFQFGAFFKKLPKKKQHFLEFVAQGTRRNKLFLKKCIDDEVGYFEIPYMWFSESLNILRPTSLPKQKVSEFGIDDDSFKDFLANLLESSNTGIVDIGTEKVELDTLPENIKKVIPNITTVLSADRGSKTPSNAVAKSSNGERIAFQLDSNKRLIATKMLTFHKGHEGLTQSFTLEEESDGTRRIVDIAPAFHSLSEKGIETEKVVIIDEIDRSLHPHITKSLALAHLEGSTNRSQLIFTTHDTNLLDLEFFRRDEIWFMEKKTSGDSSLYSLYEFQPRHDKQIKKDYLLGRYGAIPFTGTFSKLLRR